MKNVSDIHSVNTKCRLDYGIHNVLRKPYLYLFGLFGTQQDGHSEIKNGIKNEEVGKCIISETYQNQSLCYGFL